MALQSLEKSKLFLVREADKIARIATLFRRLILGGSLLLWAMSAQATGNTVEEDLNARSRLATADGGNPASAANADASELTAETPDGNLSEVVVTARNKAEKLEDVPLSISVVSGESLQRLEAVDLSSFASRVANVSVATNNQQHRAASIRGIGKMQNTHAQDPSVGIIVDGVNYAYNPLAASVEYTDVEAVEVTRGPQGTLQGKNSTLGVIDIVTRRPSFTPDANVEVTVGELGTLIGRAAGGGAVVDDVLAWRGSLSVQRGEGPYGNSYYNRGNDTYVNTDRASGRVQLLFTPIENFSARASFNIQPRAGENANGTTLNTPTPTAYANGQPNNLSSDAAVRLARRWFLQNGDYSYLTDYLSDTYHDNDAQQPVVTGSSGGSLELNWKVGATSLTSITAYEDYYFNARFNDEGTPFAIQLGSGNLHYYKQISQELRASSQLGSLADYQVGVFAINTRMNDRGSLTLYGADAGAWYANASQYSTLDANSSGQLLMQNALSGLGIIGNPQQQIDNRSIAAFGQVNWHITDPLTLTTGVRVTREDRLSENITSYVDAEGYARELNPVSVNNVQLGGFDSDAAGALKGDNTAAQIAVANSVAQKYFGIATYNALSSGQRSQVAAAKAIRKARIGIIWNSVTPPAWRGTQPAFVISPSYRINPDLNTYISWQYGEKAGIAQVTNGISNPVSAEKNSSYEAGVKASALNQALTINADIFLTNITDYQQAVSVFDQYTTLLNADGNNYYVSATGNVPKVRAKGLEIDGSFTGIAHTQIRFSGAYNDARYVSFPNSGQPPENGNLGTLAPYRDVSGLALLGASKWSFNVGADYRQPLIAKTELRVSLNSAYVSRFNSDNTLSSYGWVASSVITDLSVGIGFISGKSTDFEVDVIGKNVFDNGTVLGATWNTYIPANPRWLGVALRGSF